jgi:hypothetical protein
LNRGSFLEITDFKSKPTAGLLGQARSGPALLSRAGAAVGVYELPKSNSGFEFLRQPTPGLSMLRQKI